MVRVRGKVRCSASQRRATLVVVLALGACSTKPARSQVPEPFAETKANDFWDRLKDISLWRGGALSLGGQLRARYEYIDPAAFGVEPGSSTRSALLVRGLAHADLRVQPFLRVFVELGGFPALGLGAEAKPPDIDGAEVTQLFLEASSTLGGALASLRVGRQEMPLGSSKWVGLRDGTSVRQTFDLARLSLGTTGRRLEVFAGGVPKLERGAFDDRVDLENRFWGLYATTQICGEAFALEAFYLGRRRAAVNYVETEGRERRHTLGTRLFGEVSSGFRYIFHALGQVGTTNGRSIRAWGLAFGLWQRLPAPLQDAQLGLRGDALSGDHRASDGKVGTFHPLFPNQAFFSQFAAIYPSNIYDLHPILKAARGPVGAEGGAIFFWRQSRGDAIFTPPGNARFSPSAARFVGTQLVLAGKYQPTLRLSLNLEYSRFFAGSVIRGAGGGSVDFVGFWVTYRV